MNELRTWKKGGNYPFGAFVLYTGDGKLRTILKKKGSGFSGEMAYLQNGRSVGWDLIFPKTGDEKADKRLKGRLLAQCGDEA